MNFENSTYSTASVDDSFTLDKLIEIENSLPEITCPFCQFAESQNKIFDEVCLIFPIKYFKPSRNFIRSLSVPENVRFSSSVYLPDDHILILQKRYIDGIISTEKQTYNTKLVKREEVDFALIAKLLWELALYFSYVEFVESGELLEIDTAPDAI